jgi:hypothetical protein
LKPGKYSQASTSVSFVEKLNPPAGIGKGSPREYTHIHMGVHEDKKKETGIEEILNSVDTGSFSNPEGCCLSKYKNVNNEL